MALSEANALLEILSKVTNTVSTIRDNYNQASNDMKTFPLKLQEFEERKAEWAELLNKYPVALDDPMRPQLERASDVLQRSVNDFEASKGKSCCWRLWNKVSVPQQWSSSLSEVNEAFDSIAKGIKERRETKQLVEEETRMIKAPFRFFPDGKYVPLEKTVREIRGKLDRDDSAQYITILYGESGQGKSTLAKHMALTYYSESKSPTSSSLANTFQDGVYFFVCGRNADSKSLLFSLREELGYKVEADAVDDNRKSEVGDLRRILIARLESRVRSRLLIILDDVWHQQILGDVLMPIRTASGTSFKIQYLVTTQRRPQELWPEGGVACVQIGKPSAEEAKRILGNHIVGWKSKEFAADIQDEIDSLVKDVDNNPLILANLASIISIDDVHDLARWKGLRKELITVLKTVESNLSRPIAFGEPNQCTVLASLKMAVDNFPTQAQTMLDFLVISSVDGIDETVLKVWFKAIYGKCNLYLFRRWSKCLEECSFISLVDDSTDSGPRWEEKSKTRWCIHDLRYKLLREMRSVEIETIAMKLTGGVKAGVAGDSSSSDTEMLLGTALCLLYGSSEYTERAASNLALSQGLTPLTSYRRRRIQNFVKYVVKLLNPEYEEGLQEKVHAHAKKVILQYLKSTNWADIRDDVVGLLNIPEAVLSTCYALSEEEFQEGFPDLEGALEESAMILLEAINKYLDEPPKAYNELHLYVRALESWIARSPSLSRHLLLEPQWAKFCAITRVLLQWPWGSPLLDDTGLVVSVLGVLCGMSSHSSLSRKKLASTPDLSTTILNLMRNSSHLDRALVSTSCEAFLQIACKDEEIKAQTILLPGVLETVVPLLEHIPEMATVILKELAWTPKSAEQIASHPGALDGLVKVLACTTVEQIAFHPGATMLRSVERAIDAIAALLCTKSNQMLLLTSWPGMLQQLVQFLNESVPAHVLWRVANLVQKIIHGNKVMNQRMSSGLAEVLRKYELLLGGDVPVKSRNAALRALCVFGSDETTRTAVATHPGLLEHMINSVDVGYLAGTSFPACYSGQGIAIQWLFNLMDDSKVILSRKNTLMLRLLLKCTTLMVKTGRSGLEREACELLISATTRNPEIRDWVLTEPKALEVLFSVLEKNELLPDHGAYVTTLAKVLLFVTTDTRKSQAKSEVVMTVSERFLKNLFRLLEGDNNTELQAAVIRALLILTCRQEIHQIIVANNHILERAIELLLHEQTSSSILEPAAWIVQKCFEKERRYRIQQSYATSLTSEIGADRQAKAALGLAISSISEKNLEFMVAVPGALDSIVRLVSREATRTILTKVRQTVQLLCGGGWDPQHRDGNRSGLDFDFKIAILRSYVSLLEDDGSGKSHAAVVAAAAESLAYLLLDERDRQLFSSGCLEVKDILLRCLDRQAGLESSLWSPRFYPVMCLTLLHPGEAEQMDLTSTDALRGRGMARTVLKLYDAALEDFDRAIQKSSSEGSLYSDRAFVRAQLGETAGPLEDLDHSIKCEDIPLFWQERGIFKIIMKDYDGALSDLNTSLMMSGENDYECLKHRSLVKFLLGNEDGARIDAEHAVAVEPLYVRLPLLPYFGGIPVRFLDFDLK